MCYNFADSDKGIDDMRNRLFLLLLFVLAAAALVSCNQDAESKTFTVTFKANDESATGEMAPQKVERYVNVNLEANKFVKEDWKFGGWNTKADGTGTSYSDKALIRLAKDITLYAQWKDNRAVITFHSNYSAGEDIIQYAKKNAETELQANSFTRTDYEFTGWNTKSGGSGETIEDKAKVTVVSKLDLYAQWHHLEAVISFDKNGGEGTMADQTVPTNTSTALNANSFTRDDYVFIGWNTKADGSGTSYADQSSISIAQNLTLYAQWAVKHLISFNANGGTGTMTDQPVPENIATQLKANSFNKGTSVFKEWNTMADGSGTKYADKASITTDHDVTLYAQWIDYLYITAETTTLESYKYTITADVVIDHSVSVSGDAIIDLPDGFTLTFQKGLLVYSLPPYAYNSLTINSVGTGTGRLVATGTGGNAAIGAFDGGAGMLTTTVNINGGIIIATGGPDGGAGIGGAKGYEDQATITLGPGVSVKVSDDGETWSPYGTHNKRYMKVNSPD